MQRASCKGWSQAASCQKIHTFQHHHNRTHALYAAQLFRHRANKAHCPTSRSAQITVTKMSTAQTEIQEHHIHSFLGYVTVAASILTIGSTLALLLGQYERAGRAFSTRQGLHRRRLVQIFLGLALACFVIVLTLKFASPVARAEAANTLSGNPGSTANEHETRRTEGGYVANGDEAILKKQEIPSR